MGKLIYLAAYSIAVASFYVAEHVSKGINAARHGTQRLPPSVAAPSLIPAASPDSTERLLLQLETIIMEMISAARANDLAMLHERARVQLAIVNQLQIESTWPTERIFSFLSERGRVDLDGPAFQEMRRKVQEAEGLHGLLAS
jgi:hypothetical protein